MPLISGGFDCVQSRSTLLQRLATTGTADEKTPTFVRGGGECGAGDEIRTRDIYLGKVVLYQLSYSRITAPLAVPVVHSFPWEAEEV